MAIVYVARHGESEWNREGRYQGRREAPLSDLGRGQAAALAASLAQSGATRVISSPLARCADTAQAVAAALEAPLTTDDRLLEIAHGTWEGRLREEIEREDPVRMRAWRQTPDRVAFEGGETLAEVDARWRCFAASLTAQDDVVVVTHDVLVRLAILAATEHPLSQLWKPRVENGGYAVFEVARRWRLVEECHDTHLAGLRTDTSRQAL